MSSDWPLKPLGVIASEVTVGYVGSMAAEYVESGVPFLRSLNIEPYRVNAKDLKFVSPAFHARIKKSELRCGDVVMVRTGKPGTCAVIPEWLENANCSDLVIARCGAEIRPRFLCYWVNSMASHHISSHTVGAVQQHFNVGSAKTMLVAVPSIPVQDEVLAVLGGLDDRITLLRETNATLEAIAQALFKSWFVDFDPVHARVNGSNPEFMDNDTAALFPTEFCGETGNSLPKGWSTQSIYAISNVIYGAPFASAKFNGIGVGKPLVRIRDLRDEAPGVFTDEVHQKGYLLRAGDIAVGMDGEFRAYLWGGSEAWLNQRVCVFKPLPSVPSAFVRMSIQPLLAAVEESETATTVIHLGKNDVDRFRVLVPTEEVMRAFAAIVNPIYDRIVASKQTMATLAALRDTLLPQLVSGQLRLPEAHAALAEAEAA